MMRIFYLLFVFLTAFLTANAQQPFITTWKVPEYGQVKFGASGGGYNYTVDFGNGDVQTNVTGESSTSYLEPGIYTITITGDFPRLIIQSTYNQSRIQTVEQWGDIEWQSMENAFINSYELIINATDAPDLSQVESLKGMFNSCQAMNQSIDHWDVSNVTDMSEMFANAQSFNQPLNSWDVSNVTNMNSMFSYAYRFNQPIGNWNVGNVIDMATMFEKASDFDQDISAWDTSNVTTFKRIFADAERFNQPLNSWDTGNVTNMEEVFSNATKFNQPLGAWNVSNVTTMSEMFNGASAFNQDIGSWDVSNVTDMTYLFQDAKAFNHSINSWDVSQMSSLANLFQNATAFDQPLNDWDVSNVTNMSGMFYGATSFNQPLDNWDVSNVSEMRIMFMEARSFNHPIDSWNVSNVVSMERMFSNAKSFDQPLSSWNITNVLNFLEMFKGTDVYNQNLSNWSFNTDVNLTGFLSNSGLDFSNYELLLARFDNLGLQNKNLGAEGLLYCDELLRNNLINSGWTITGDNLLFDCDFTLPTGAFVTRWEATPSDRSIHIPTFGSGYNYSIDFGDGTILNNVTGDVTHTYSTPAVYSVSISGDFPRITMSEASSPEKLRSVEQWGDIQWTSMSYAFSECSKLKIKAIDAPDLSQVTNMNYMFRSATSFDESINHWDVSNVTSMEGTFMEAVAFNQPLNNWDVSNVTNMTKMFRRAIRFNRPINNWDVSSVTNMNQMFSIASRFNQPLNNWNVSNVTNMAEMFGDGFNSFEIIFNQPLEDWDVSNVTTMESMFQAAIDFNQPLNNWDVSSVTDMTKMFHKAKSFNQPLDNWDVSSVTTMESTFHQASEFNQSINSWDVSQVTNMKNMFNGNDGYGIHGVTDLFNQPLNDWDVSNVNNMNRMFSGAHSFNQPLDNWNVSQVTNMESMFDGARSFNGSIYDWDVSNVTTMKKMFSDCPSFDKPLNNWNVSSVTTMEGMFGTGSLGFENIFNQPLDNWNVSNVLTMRNMFEGAVNFNQSLNDWDVSNVTDISSMFLSAKSFNQPLDNWDVSNITNMRSAFEKANSFNQPLNNWDVSHVERLNDMFKGDSENPWDYSFNQPLDNWDVSNASLSGMFYYAHNFNQDLSSWEFSSNGLNLFVSYSGLDVRNYDALLRRFAELGHSNIRLGANNLEYCNEGAHDYLENNLNWTIRGDSLSTECNLIIGTILYDEDDNGCDPNDVGVNAFMINVNDGTNDYVTFSIDGNYSLATSDTALTVSVINAPSYIDIEPEFAHVTFTNSNIEEVDFCITENMGVSDLNIRMTTISEARPGYSSRYQLTIENLGTETIDNISVSLVFDDAMQSFESSDPVPTSNSNNELIFEHLNLLPFTQKTIDITMETYEPPIVEGGDVLIFTADVTPIENDITPEDNTYTLEQVVVNSFDPNDKQVMQGDEIYIDEIDQYLDYIIRFQNTGTASAINVCLLDTLHPKLDWNSIQPINASHDYHIEISNGNKVEFIFNDINLPHEGANESESHGFVAYKIKPKSNVEVGDVITGDARIYFDYNPPIITNTVSTEIVDAIVGVTDYPGLKEQIKIYPNPTDQILNINLTDNVKFEEVIIYSLQGQEIKKSKEKTINVGNLMDGIYFIKISTDQGVANRRFIKN